MLVTGASQNIGRHLALEYAKLGANIVVTARREEKLKEVGLNEMKWQWLFCPWNLFCS